MIRMLETVEELLALPVGSVLDYGVTKLYADEPAGLNFVAPGSAMGYTAHEFKLPIALLKEGLP